MSTPWVICKVANYFKRTKLYVCHFNFTFLNPIDQFDIKTKNKNIHNASMPKLQVGRSQHEVSRQPDTNGLYVMFRPVAEIKSGSQAVQEFDGVHPAITEKKLKTDKYIYIYVFTSLYNTILDNNQHKCLSLLEYNISHENKINIK